MLEIVILTALCVIFACASIFFFLLSMKRKNQFQQYSKMSGQLAQTALYSFLPQMEIIFSFMVSLDELEKLEADTALVESMNETKKLVYSIRDNIHRLNQKYQSNIKNRNAISYEDLSELTEQLKLLNRSIYNSSLRIIATIGNFSEQYIVDKTILSDSNHTMARLIFYLTNVVPIISDFTNSSNEISKTIILEMVNKFETLTVFSDKITKEIRQKMVDLMDEENDQSLTYVVRRTDSLVEEFKVFFSNMEHLRDVSNNFVTKSIEKLKSIADIANSIGEIAETIKVLSLNVSIEAANTGSLGKGFQVLARDLREFAYRTLQFSIEVKTRVGDTIETTEALQEDYLKNITNVFTYVETIRDSLKSFAASINFAFSQIKSVIDSLEEFSQHIDAGIKGVVGQLQFYDVSSQEVEHISIFINQILNMFSSNIETIQINHILRDAEKAQIRVDLVNGIRDFITTANEYDIIKKYEKQYELLKTEKEGSGETDSESNKRGDIILF